LDLHPPPKPTSFLVSNFLNLAIVIEEKMGKNRANSRKIVKTKNLPKN
jgi:hypothetical protein